MYFVCLFVVKYFKYTTKVRVQYTYNSFQVQKPPDTHNHTLKLSKNLLYKSVTLFTVLWTVRPTLGLQLTLSTSHILPQYSSLFTCTVSYLTWLSFTTFILWNFHVLMPSLLDDLLQHRQYYSSGWARVCCSYTVKTCSMYDWLPVKCRSLERNLTIKSCQVHFLRGDKIYKFQI